MQWSGEVGSQQLQSSEDQGITTGKNTEGRNVRNGDGQGMEMVMLMMGQENRGIGKWFRQSTEQHKGQKVDNELYITDTLPVIVAKINKTNDCTCGQQCRVKVKLIHCWWECKVYNHYGNWYGDSSGS